MWAINSLLLDISCSNLLQFDPIQKLSTTAATCSFLVPTGLGEENWKDKSEKNCGLREWFNY